MSINQNVRSNPTVNNPSGILSDLLNIGRFLVNNVDPLDEPNGTGVDSDMYINSSSHDLFGPRQNGKWGPPVYNFGGGGGGGGLTSLQNVGEGVRTFLGLNGTLAQVRSLTSDFPVIIAEDAPIVGSNNFSISDLYKPVSLSLVDNNPLQTGLGSATLNPNGTLGEIQGYKFGSLFVQVGTQYVLWVCVDPVAKVWEVMHSQNSTLEALTNIGPGAEVYETQVGNVAQLRTMIGETGEIDILQNPADLVFSMSDLYKPVTLTNVDNVKIGYQKLSAPLGTDDVTKGYLQGSLYIETETGGLNKIWICRSPTPAGSAQWVEYETGGASVKESAMFYNIPRATVNFSDGSFNNLPIVSAVVDQSGPATWSAPFSGTTVVFRRGPTNASGKRYLVNVDIIIQDFVGAATTLLHNYTFRMLQNPSAVTQHGSAIQIGLNASVAVARQGTGSTSFIITSNTAGTDEWYYQISGSAGALTPSIAIENMSVTFTEI